MTPMEAYKLISDTIEGAIKLSKEWGDDEETWKDTKEALKVIKDKFEVLELLRKKRVDVGYILSDECESFGDYNSYQSCRPEYILTEEEFEKIKRWLNESET